jgi:hypothetical protein
MGFSPGDIRLGVRKPSTAFAKTQAPLLAAPAGAIASNCGAVLKLVTTGGCDNAA